jgi:succinyl-CoA synthetase beta subunit
MDLLEYQAKELFRQVGIPVLPSQQIHDPRDLKQLKISYPVVLKSQVRVGGRGRAGGIKFVNNTIDAIAAARNIFNLPILGEYPRVLLAEARYNAEQELFLAIVLDYELKRPVLLGSARGGIDVKDLLDNLQKVVVEESFYPFYARRLAIKMGLIGKPVQSISNIIEKMYDLFIRKDLDLIEINPLGIDKKGEVMALDGKINVNDCGLARHSRLLELTQTNNTDHSTNERYKDRSNLHRINLVDGIDDKGNIAVICSGLDLALATWDTIVFSKGKLCCCYAISDDRNSYLAPENRLEKQLKMTLDKIGEIRTIKTILINLLDSQESSKIVVTTLVNYLQPNIESANAIAQRLAFGEIETVGGRAKKVDRIQFVLRLPKDSIEKVTDLVVELPIYIYDSIEAAVDRTISLAKAR